VNGAPPPDGEIPNATPCALSAGTSPTIGKLVAALAKAQGAMGPARKDRTGRVVKNGELLYTYGYASLASVKDAVRGPLAANDLTVNHLTDYDGPEGVGVITILAHASGEFMRARLWMPAMAAGAQARGSALTYAQRYALTAIVGIAADDDDDAAAAEPNAAEPTSAPASRAAPPVVHRDLKPANLPAPPAAAAAPPARVPDSELPELSQLEAIAVVMYTPQWPAVRTPEQLVALRTAAGGAGGGNRASERYQRWFWESLNTTQAAIGVPVTRRPDPASPSSGPVNTRPALALAPALKPGAAS
jgi:hypothetical protein